MTNQSASNIARQFAAALDEENDTAAAALLNDDCIYTCRGSEYQGPIAIMAAYRGTGDSAKDKLDRIDYESEVRSVSDSEAMIYFTDHVTHQEKTFTFRCQQRIRIDENNQIVRIEHIDLEGQREGLAKFMQQVGVEWK